MKRRTAGPVIEMTQTDSSGSTTCGFLFTTTGRPCAHPVLPGAMHCRAGHPCVPPVTLLDGVARPHPVALAANRGKRATELLGRALASDDAETLGLRAEEVLVDPELALVMLGGPAPVDAARHAVVQHYGRVGALLVVGYEDRFVRRVASQGTDALPHSHESEDIAPGDRAGTCIERLITRFDFMDAGEINEILAELDVVEGRGIGDNTVKARRWLHATYAVAGRDGRDEAHHSYMLALDTVMQLARCQVAS